MSYKYNQLLKLNLQKVDNNGGGGDDTPKVTKFFSATDTLEDGEIAEYQGTDDAVNRLTNGYFYKVANIQLPSETVYWKYEGQRVIELNGYRFAPGNYYVVREPSYSSGFDYFLWPYSSGLYYNVRKSGQSLQVGDKIFDSTNYTLLTITAINVNIVTLSNGATFDRYSQGTGTNFQDLYDCIDDNGIAYSIVRCAQDTLVIHYTITNGVFNLTDWFWVPFVYYYRTTSPTTIKAYIQTDTQPRTPGVTVSDGVLQISLPVEFSGNITVHGSEVVVTTEQIQSENDFIKLRYNNPLALANNERSGIEVNNYDGNGTDCILAVDNQGWARIGDKSGTLQKLATIQDSPKNNFLLKYNTTSKQLESVDYFLAVSRITCPLDINDTQENFAKWVLDYFYNENIIRHVIINTIVTWGSDYWVQGATYAYSDKYCYFTFQQTAGSLNKFFARYQNNVFKFNE